MKFRNDIQGLRALAVITVVFFHLGNLPNGYLGVDVFFVISGFLITGILFRDFINDRYSIKEFYVKRIRRIIPLVLLINLLALILGYFFMLPDDYENLAQSVVATNFFSNNILQYITVGDYWDVINEYKPLMHTWSLGIEEQYYILFPLIFLFINKKKKSLVNLMLILTILSLFVFLITKNESSKFYLLPTRFFEISIGGIIALISSDLKKNSLISNISLVILCMILFFDIGIGNDLNIIVTIISTASIILFNNENSVANRFLSCKPIVFIGTISFSFYMWHQLILSFYRYIYSTEITLIAGTLLILVTVCLSILSYYFVENYFRKSENISTQKLLILSIFLFFVTSTFSLYVYLKGGVVKDFPELSLYSTNAVRKMNSQYNDRIYNYNKAFSTTDKIKVLIIGDSFGRDWANVLLESKYKNDIEISYISNPDEEKDVQTRLLDADALFFSYLEGFTLDELRSFTKKYKISSRFYIVGTKNFGINNGVVYNSDKNDKYCFQRVNIEQYTLDLNNKMVETWATRYINVLALFSDRDNQVPVFTPNCKFISQDCRHFTKDGAVLFNQKADVKKYLIKK